MLPGDIACLRSLIPTMLAALMSPSVPLMAPQEVIIMQAFGMNLRLS